MSIIRIKRILQALLALSVSFFPSAYSQSSYPPPALNFKTMFAELELRALAQDFVGVHEPSGIEEGLFPLEITGVTTVPIMQAANLFLATLSNHQLLSTQFSVNDPEWRRWFNVDNGIYVRQGTSLAAMNAEQKAAAWSLLEVSLSAKGLQLSRDIMKTDKTLSELNNDSLSYDEELYFFTLMGTPSPTEPWGWQLDGHHLVINYFVLGDQVVMTPVFMGGEPIVTTTGLYAGNSILQEEQNAGLAFFQSLSEVQRNLALLEANKTTDQMRAAALQDNLELAYTGLPGAQLNTSQKEALLNLIDLYVSNNREEHAQIKLEEVMEHMDQTWFSWVGGMENDSVFYYRIHSPVLLIEFDHQNPVGNPTVPQGIPTRQHIHTIVRTPNGNDYGKDLLRQHLDLHPH